MSPKNNWRARAGTVFTTEKQLASGARGVISCNHPIAAAAGAEMLTIGGNAVDAAIAALFTLNVVEPMMVGIFGAGWMNIRLADGENIVIDNYASAPGAATSDFFTPISDTWPDYMETADRANMVGYKAVATPGTLKAWTEAVEQWGRLDLFTVMQPAIRHARAGFPASAYLCELIMDKLDDLAGFPATADLFLPGGRALQKGDRVIQPELGESLEAIAREGADVLYGGALGQHIIADIQRNGGILSLDDLRNYTTVRRNALTGNYRGYDVSLPEPPCAGGLHILQILRILEAYDVASLGFGSADAIHLIAECLKIAFADRAAYVGDPDQVDIPVDWLLSDAYAADRRAGVDMQQAAVQNPGIQPSAEPDTTTHVTSADAEGNIACLTQTINHTFGCKVMVPGTGVLLNNCMALFDPHPGQANSVRPDRRTISSVSPTIITKDGRPFMALGTPGGVRIFPSVAQAIVNVIDHGMTLQEAVEAPRIWTQGQELEVEDAIGQTICNALALRGHDVKKVKTIAGCMNGILFDTETGMMSGAACWRADGSPIALGGGWARAGVRFQTMAGAGKD